MSWPGDLVPLSAPVDVVDQCPQNADVGAGEDAFSVQVGHPFLVPFDQGALEPLVDQHLVARGGALRFGEFDLHSALADRSCEHELFHPDKVGLVARKVKGRKGEFLGWIWVFVGRVWGAHLAMPLVAVVVCDQGCSIILLNLDMESSIRQIIII